MNKTKRVYINAVNAVILVSLLFIDNLSSDKAVATTSSPSAPNATEPVRNTATAGGRLTNNTTNNATNATTSGAISEIINEKLENTTSALANATAALTTATNAFQGVISNPSARTPPPNTSTNASAVNATSVISSIFDNNLPAVFIIVIASIIGVPLVLDIILAYRRKPPTASIGGESSNNRVVGMPDLYRSLMTFGIIVLVGTVIFYLLALITLNINDSSSPALQSLIDVLKSLGTILGTALATIIAFYFGTRAAESATEKATAAAAAGATVTKTGGAAAAAVVEKEPPKVLNTIPADGATQVPITSLITATFSGPMSSPTINENTFTIKRADDEATLIKGALSLSPDGKTAIFDPDQDLSPNTKYIAEINTGAKDLAGNALVSTKRWSFSTTTSA
ncbi:MAG: Ig-like domain-containing protein [Thermoproteota archaeon]|nr:Ig-like domain-containing protein [Thermoproteota archaeon]